MRKVVLVSMAGALLAGFAGSVAQADIITGLVAHWKLDETVAGPVVNQVGADGTNNGATIGQTGQDVGGPGVGGTAYLFNRANENFVDTSLSTIIPASDDFSIFAWINTTSHTGTGTGAAHDYAGYIFSNYRVGDTGRTALQVADGDLKFFVSSENMAASAVNDGDWHHVGVTRDSSGFRLWVDGTPTGYGMTSGVESINFAGLNWRIAGPVTNPTGTGNTRYFNGLIDDVRVYDRALTASDVALLIPEPSSVLLLSMALLAGLLRRRRRV